jgi:hypothetical protein
MYNAWTVFLQSAGECWAIVSSAKSEVWAAWFQAVGSVGAIIAAIWISRRQTNLTRSIASEEFDRKSEAVSSFAAVQHINIRNDIRRIRAVIGNNEANLGMLKGDGANAALATLLFASTNVDDYVLSNASFLLRDARLAFPQLIAMKEMYNARMRELYEAMDKAKEPDLAKVNNVSGKLLEAIDKLLSDIRSSAAAVNDAAVLEMRAKKKS